MSYRDSFGEQDNGYISYLDEMRQLAVNLQEWRDHSDGEATAEDVLQWFLSPYNEDGVPEGWDDDDTAVLRRELQRVYDEDQ